MVTRRAAIEAEIARLIDTEATPGALAQEQIPADTEFTLAVGDSFAAPSPSGGEFRNDGTEVASLLSGYVVPVAAATPTP